jgi:hypothetical protein
MLTSKQSNAARDRKRAFTFATQRDLAAGKQGTLMMMAARQGQEERRVLSHSLAKANTFHTHDNRGQTHYNGQYAGQYAGAIIHGNNNTGDGSGSSTVVGSKENVANKRSLLEAAGLNANAKKYAKLSFDQKKEALRFYHAAMGEGLSHREASRKFAELESSGRDFEANFRRWEQDEAAKAAGTRAPDMRERNPVFDAAVRGEYPNHSDFLTTSSHIPVISSHFPHTSQTCSPHAS